MSVILDAGPTLNFLAVGQQTVLISLANKGGLQLTVPQRVDHEVLGMCNDPRFAKTPAQATWRKAEGCRPRRGRPGRADDHRVHGGCDAH